MRNQAPRNLPADSVVPDSVVSDSAVPDSVVPDSAVPDSGYRSSDPRPCMAPDSAREKALVDLNRRGGDLPVVSSVSTGVDARAETDSRARRDGAATTPRGRRRRDWETPDGWHAIPALRVLPRPRWHAEMAPSRKRSCAGDISPAQREIERSEITEGCITEGCNYKAREQKDESCARILA